MIIGGHSIIYSTSADADRAFLKNVLKLSHVDVGGGWLIFGLPPAEIAVHPGDKNDQHEFYFMCDDIDGFISEMSAAGIACSPVQDQGWGVLTQLTMPGGGKLGVYQPRHARPAAMSAAASSSSARSPARKASGAKKQTSRKPAPRKAASKKKTVARKPAPKKQAAKRAKKRR